MNNTKKLHFVRWICIIGLTLFFCLIAWLIIVVLSVKPLPETDAYVNYRIDDFNLICVDIERFDNRIGRYHDETFNRDIIYYQIREQENFEFIAANIDANPLETVPTLVVMQSERNQIHVTQDWTISTVQFYTLGEVKDASELHWNNNVEILYTTQESDIISHFQTVVKFDERHTFPAITQDPNFYVSSFESLNNKPLYIRMLFEESDDIAWVIQIEQIQGSFYIKAKRPYEVNYPYLEVPSPYEYTFEYILVEQDSLLYNIITSIL